MNIKNTITLVIFGALVVLFGSGCQFRRTQMNIHSNAGVPVGHATGYSGYTGTNQPYSAFSAPYGTSNFADTSSETEVKVGFLHDLAGLFAGMITIVPGDGGSYYGGQRQVACYNQGQELFDPGYRQRYPQPCYPPVTRPYTVPRSQVPMQYPRGYRPPPRRW